MIGEVRHQTAPAHVRCWKKGFATATISTFSTVGPTLEVRALTSGYGRFSVKATGDRCGKNGRAGNSRYLVANKRYLPPVSRALLRRRIPIACC